MAKFYGSGVLTGKSGNKVYAVRKGVVIERQYMPVVLNPKSEAQTIQRAKFKTMSQLSAIMRPAVAVRTIGLESKRNAFSRQNKGIVTWNTNSNKVDVNLLMVDLTGSSAGIPPLSPASAGATVQASLSRNPLSGEGEIDGMMYFAFADMAGKLELVSSAVVTNPGGDLHYSTNLSFGTGLGGVIYGYGFKYLSERASVVYGELIAESGTAASLLVSRMVSDDDISFTATRAIEIIVA